MPEEPVPGHDTHYHLIGYDASGRERPEPSGRYSRAVLADAHARQPTDVVLMSHGWQGDVPAARRQYGNWVAAMLACGDERDRLAHREGGFRPLLVGVHWPSRAWGDEELGDASFAVGDESRSEPGPVADSLAELVGRYAARLGADRDLEAAVATIVEHALVDPVPPRLPGPVRDAYQRIDLLVSTPAGPGGSGAPPGEDREAFDPEATYQACLLEDVADFGGASLGGLLAPLRMLTFWQMKRRARAFGSSGATDLLRELRTAAPKARVHMMGHSFGCIVATAAVAGLGGDESGPVVSTLVLAQGAMSLWSFCSSIPSRPDRPGFFNGVVADGLVAGATLATTSAHDRAVRAFYPLGAGVAHQVDFAPGELPTYGGIGVWGVRGPGVTVVDERLVPDGSVEIARPGTVVNLDATAVIRAGGGASGAHNDICHPEVARVVWQAIGAAPPI